VGTGGFGLVYRGVLPVWQCPKRVRGRNPTQDVEVAVKVLDVDTTLSDQRFRSQVELLGRLKHKYLVSHVPTHSTVTLVVKLVLGPAVDGGLTVKR
jgi:hypothetical protein